MFTPSTSSAARRPDLLGCLQELDLAADRLGFIGGRVLPTFEAAKSAQAFKKIALETLLQNPEVTRNAKSEYNRITGKFDDDSYTTSEKGLEGVVDDNLKNMYKDFFDAEVSTTELVVDAILRARERRIADMIFNATTWTGSSLTTAVGMPWSTAASAKPIDDVNAAREKVWIATGLYPNALIINRKVFEYLRLCDQVKDDIQSAGAGQATKQRDITIAQLSQVFDLDYIFVAGGAKNTANPADAAAISRIWSNSYAMVARVCVTNNILEPGLGRSFHWSGDGSEEDGLVETYYQENVRGEVVRARHQIEEKVMYKECGHLLTNIAA